MPSTATNGTGAPVFRVVVTGEVRPRSGGDAHARQRSTSFAVAALWPDAAMIAGRQLFIDRMAREGMVTQGTWPKVTCTPEGARS